MSSPKQEFLISGQLCLKWSISCFYHCQPFLPRMHVNLHPLVEGKEPAELTVHSQFLTVAGFLSMHMPLVRTSSWDPLRALSQGWGTVNCLPGRRAKGFRKTAGLCHITDLPGQQLPFGKHWLSLARLVGLYFSPPQFCCGRTTETCFKLKSDQCTRSHKTVT